MILGFILSFFHSIAAWFPWKRNRAVKPKTTRYVVNNDFHFPGNWPSIGGTRNKKYADQRQKAPHNRRRKPSKAMRHLYHLK